MHGSYVASTTLMLKAVSELTKLLPKHNVNLNIKTLIIAEKFLVISWKC